MDFIIKINYDIVETSSTELIPKNIDGELILVKKVLCNVKCNLTE